MKSTLYGSRLVSLLQGITQESSSHPQSDFAFRLGQLMDFSGSLTLSRALEELKTKRFEPATLSAQAITDEFMQTRSDLVRFVVMGFVPRPGRARRQLPTPDTLQAHYTQSGVYRAGHPLPPRIQAAAYEPYREFYVTTQRDLAIKIAHLRIHVRDALTGISPHLAQLSMLDGALSDALANRSRDIFAVIPQLLGKRFGHLLNIHRPELPDQPEATDIAHWFPPDGWLAKFYQEMRELLLAELDTRLQPVLGMLNALPSAESVNH